MILGVFLRLTAAIINTWRRTSLGPVHSSRFVFISWNLDVGHESANVER